MVLTVRSFRIYKGINTFYVCGVHTTHVDKHLHYPSSNVIEMRSY